MDSIDLEVSDLRDYIKEVEYNFQLKVDELESEIEFLKAEISQFKRV